MAGLVRVAKFVVATFAAVLLVSQAVVVDSTAAASTTTTSTTTAEVSMAIFILALSMGVIVIAVSMAVSIAVNVSRALYNFFTHTGDASRIKILSYNVSFNNHKLHERMEALGGLILSHFPDVICFQEVTWEIYGIFEKSVWWKFYNFSVLHETMKTKPFFCMQLSKLPVNSISFIPFNKFRTRKKISMVEIEVCRGKPLAVATSHLKCSIPGKTFSEKRVAQAKTALNLLKNYPNVIFGGDMNWNEEVDDKFPLLDGWVDAWTKLRPLENGWTYDTKENPMLSSQVKVPLQKRFDRFICNLHDFKLMKIDIIGIEAIPGLSHVLPSDHYGLLLEVQSK